MKSKEKQESGWDKLPLKEKRRIAKQIKLEDEGDKFHVVFEKALNYELIRELHNQKSDNNVVWEHALETEYRYLFTDWLKRKKHGITEEQFQNETTFDNFKKFLQEHYEEEDRAKNRFEKEKQQHQKDVGINKERKGQEKNTNLGDMTTGTSIFKSESLEVTYALVIAVEEYNKPEYFPKVSYAINDAHDIIDALIGISVHKDDIILLINEKATKSAIITELKTLSNRTLENDRIIIYFAGHGVYINENNHIVPVDAYKTNLQDTCISINEILGYLKKSACDHNLFFLDCCHSGFEPGEIIRDIDVTFLADELKYEYREETYCIGFASCKSSQVSVSDHKLQNGVWSHFLIKALKGNAGKIYEHGILFSDKLQGYLNKNVSEFVKMYTTDKKDQTPILFGNLTDRFVIADLNAIFNEQERNSKISDVSFTNITLLSEDDGEVKSLPGFQKGYHHVPNNQYPGADSFIKDVGEKLVKDEINELSEQVKKKLEYKRKEIKAWAEGGEGAINTPDFTYTMEICQSDEDPEDYVLIRKLEGFSNSPVILDSELNSIFSNHFKKLEFELPNRVNIENLIDTIEDLDGNHITVQFNPADMSKCSVSIEGLDYDIQVTAETFSITSSYQTSPEKLISAYQETHKAILANPNLKLLTE